MSAARLLWPLYRARWRRVLVVFALAATTAAAGLALLGVSGWFLSGAALAGSMLTFNLFVPSSLIRVFSFVRIGSRYAEKLVGHATTLQLLADLRTQAFAAMMRQPAANLMHLREGDSVSTLTADIDALDAVFLTLVVPVCIALLAGGVLASVWWPRTAAAAFVLGVAAVLAVAILPALLARGAYVYGLRAQSATRRARHEMLATIAAHTDLAALGATAVAQHRFEASLQAGVQARLAQARLSGAGLAALQAVAGWCVMGVLYAGIVAWKSEAVTGPVLAGLVLATLGFFELAVPVMRNAARLGAAQAASERIAAMIGAPAALPQSAQPHALPVCGTLSLTGVRAGYDPQALVIDDLSLDIPAGQRVAIVGASGTGKSTLLNLMMRLQDPYAGAVRFGGIDLRDAATEQWHRRVALLTQDAPVFLGTVRTNLLIGNDGASDTQLWQALDDARLGDYVRTLPQGLDTWTGETGWTLSAGQARRLCLARVLLTDASVWLLDEPTAGLDAENESAFFQALAACARGRTVIVATHAHLPALAVDRVFVMPARGGYSLRCAPLPL